MSKILTVSEASSIAIHSLAYIAKNDHKINSATLIAEETGFSKNHLAKVLQRMVKYNYLKSSRGPTGGFILKKKPEEITLLEVYTIMEGEMEIEHCFMHSGSCPLEKCIFAGISEKMNAELKNHFEITTIADIIKK